MTRDIFLALLAKKLSDGLTAEEPAEFDSIRTDHEEHQQLEAELTAYFQQKKDVPAHLQDNLGKTSVHLDKTQDKLNRTNVKLDKTWAAIEDAERSAQPIAKNSVFRLYPVLKIAGVLVLMVAAGLLYAVVKKPGKGLEQLFTVQTPASSAEIPKLKWTQDSLVFKKEKLKELAAQLEKKYKVKIEIRNEQLKNKRFSGMFTGESLKDALEALKLSYPFVYAIDGQLIVIDEEK